MNKYTEIRRQLVVINSATQRIQNLSGGVIQSGAKTMKRDSVELIKADADAIKSAIQNLAHITGVEY